MAENDFLFKGFETWPTSDLWNYIRLLEDSGTCTAVEVAEINKVCAELERRIADYKRRFPTSTTSTTSTTS